MRLTHELIGLVAGIVATLGFIPYIVSIFRNRVVPSKASWTIWTLVGTAIALSYKTSGATTSIWVPVSYAVCPGVVLVVVLCKNRTKEKWPKIDRICFQIGLALFGPWVVFKAAEYFGTLPSWGWILPIITLWGGIAVDGFGAVPTIVKSWKEPGSESFWGWTFWCVGNTLNLWAVETWNWSNGSYAVYIVLPSVTIWPTLLMYKLKNCGLSPRTAPAN